ncbi:F-box protein SKIP1 [Tanacetum coccineum]
MAINKHHRNNNQSGKPACADLPHDCLVNIFKFLTMMERCQSGTMLVCKSWLHATKDHALYTVCDLESRMVLKDELVRWWVPAESVHWWTPEYESKMDNMLRAAVALSNGSLKEIRVRHCSDRSLLLVAERCLIHAITLTTELPLHCPEINLWGEVRALFIYI